MKKTLLLSCALALLGSAPAAFAADGAGFLRAEVGTSDLDAQVAGLGRISDDDTSAILSGGYWFNPYVALEGHLGTLYTERQDDGTDFDLVTAGVGVALKKNFGAEGEGFFVGGRAGVARVTAQVREDSFTVVDDEHSTKAYFGVNVGYDFNERFGLSLNWDRRQADYPGIETDIDTLALGGEFRF